MFFYATGGWKQSKMVFRAAFKLQSNYTRKPDGPKTGNLVNGGARKSALPASQGPKTGIEDEGRE
jgi:hypothetical protein